MKGALSAENRIYICLHGFTLLFIDEPFGALEVNRVGYMENERDRC